MRIFVAVLVLLSIPVLLSTVSADTQARVVEVDGSLLVVLPDESTVENVGPSQEIPPGSTLVAATGCRARVEISGLGVLTLTGPATVRLESVWGTPAVVLTEGAAVFKFGAGRLILQADGGKLGLESIGGYSGDLVAGTSIIVSGDSNSANVEVRRGSTLLARGSEYVRLKDGDSFGSAPSGAPEQDGSGEGTPTTLRSREGDIILPPETAKSGANSDSPLVRDMVETWQQDRESPRVP